MEFFCLTGRRALYNFILNISQEQVGSEKEGIWFYGKTVVFAGNIKLLAVNSIHRIQRGSLPSRQYSRQYSNYRGNYNSP